MSAKRELQAAVQAYEEVLAKQAHSNRTWDGAFGAMGMATGKALNLAVHGVDNAVQSQDPVVLIRALKTLEKAAERAREEAHRMVPATSRLAKRRR